MPGQMIKIVKAKCACADKPSPNDYGVGSEWLCFDCRWVWQLVDTAEKSRHWERVRKLPEEQPQDSILAAFFN